MARQVKHGMFGQVSPEQITSDKIEVWPDHRTAALGLEMTTIDINFGAPIARFVLELERKVPSVLLHRGCVIS